MIFKKPIKATTNKLIPKIATKALLSAPNKGLIGVGFPIFNYKNGVDCLFFSK